VRRNLAGTISNARLCSDLITLAMTSNITLHKRAAYETGRHVIPSFKFHLTLHT